MTISTRGNRIVEARMLDATIVITSHWWVGRIRLITYLPRPLPKVYPNTLYATKSGSGSKEIVSYHGPAAASAEN